MHLASYDNHLEDEVLDREEAAHDDLSGSEVVLDGTADDDLS